MNVENRFEQNFKCPRCGKTWKENFMVFHRWEGMSVVTGYDDNGDFGSFNMVPCSDCWRDGDKLNYSGSQTI